MSNAPLIGADVSDASTDDALLRDVRENFLAKKVADAWNKSRRRSRGGGHVANTLQTPSFNFEKERQARKERLKEGVREYSKQSGLDLICKVDNLKLAYLNVFCLVLLGVANVAYTFYQVITPNPIISKASETAIWLLGIAITIEFAVAFFYSSRAVAHSALLFFCLSGEKISFRFLTRDIDAWEQTQHVVRCLRTAGSFSLLWFLPFPPAKPFYWFTNASSMMYFLRTSGSSNPSCLEVILHKLWTFLKGLACATFVFFAIPSAIQKLGMLSNHFNRLEQGWATVEWFQFFCVLNQISKMWIPRQLELVGHMRYLDAMVASAKKEEKDWMMWESGSGRDFMDTFVECIHLAFTRRLHSIAMMSFLDLGMIGHVLGLAGLSPGPSISSVEATIEALASVSDASVSLHP